MKTVGLINSTYVFLVRWFSDGLIGVLMGVFTSIAIGIFVSNDSQIGLLVGAASLSLVCVVSLIPIMVIRNRIQEAVDSIKEAASTPNKWTTKADPERLGRTYTYLGSFVLLVLCTVLLILLLSLGAQERSRQEYEFLNSVHSQLKTNQRLSEEIQGALPSLDKSIACQDEVALLRSIRSEIEQLSDQTSCAEREPTETTSARE